MFPAVEPSDVEALTGLHRLRRGAPVLSEELPQSWVPRVVNLALALFFLAFLVPLAHQAS